MIVATSATAMAAYWRGGRVDWKLTAVIGSTMLLSLLAGVLVVAGVLMLRNPAKGAAPVVRGGNRWLWHRHFGGHDYRINLPLMLGASALVSMVSGMLGITGGIIILPIMVLLRRPRRFGRRQSLALDEQGRSEEILRRPGPRHRSKDDLPGRRGRLIGHRTAAEPPWDCGGSPPLSAMPRG